MDIFKKFAPHFKTARDKINTNPSKVGEAAYKILKQDQAPVTVEEILEEYQHKYAEEMQSTIDNNFNRYESPFYIVVLTKKEPWAPNVVRNWFIARQTRPTAKYLRNEYPNYMHTVYAVNKEKCELKLLWNLPTAQDAQTILKNGFLYDAQLVGWIEDYNSGKLDNPISQP
jgi:hypothetical protein